MNGNTWECSECKAVLPDDEYVETRKKKHLKMHKDRGTSITEEALKFVKCK